MEENDLDRIEIITVAASSSSRSDLHSTDSQQLLTNVETNFISSDERNSLYDDCNDAQEPVGISSECKLFRSQQYERKRLSSCCTDSYRGMTPTNMVRRWSQNISRNSKNKRSLRDRTIFRLPSRKVFEIDGKLLTSTGADPEEEIKQLAMEIEQHDHLMEDTLIGEQHRLETLRALPQPLSTKRILKQQLSIVIEQHSTEATFRNICFKRASSVCLYAILKIWKFVCIIFNGIELWYEALNRIEGHYGSNVCSYFKFLRWLFFLNLLMLICIIGFIALPQVLYGLSDKPAMRQSNSVVFHDNNTFHLTDLLTGEGKLESSLMFYGSYTNETFSFKSSQSKYSLPHAYYMTLLILYLLTFVVISTSMARSYRKSFIENSSGIRSMYAQKIFCSWDYSIANQKAADLKHFTISTELKELLTKIGESGQKRSILWKLWTYCSRYAAHLLVGILITGVVIAILHFLQKLDEYDVNSSLKSLYIAMIIYIPMQLMQTIFSWIAKLEDYRSPRRTFHVTLMRNFLLEILVIGVLIYYWLIIYQPTKKKDECWETSIGQEIYRLFIADVIISLFVLPLVCSFRVFVVSRYWPECSRPEFNVSQKSLGLVFNQTLLWLGLLFSPLLSIIIVVKMVLMFYAHEMLLHVSKSPQHIWRSSQTHTYYLVFTFLSLLGIIITHGYIMTQVPVSSHCGPFRDYAYMFQIFIDGVLKLRQNQTMWRLLMILIRPAIVGGILIIMTIIVYYLRAKSRARCIMVKLLKEMLHMENKDKQYLLSHITKISKGREWLLDGNEKDRDNCGAEELSRKWQYNTNVKTICTQNADKKAGVNGECVLRSRNV